MPSNRLRRRARRGSVGAVVLALTATFSSGAVSAAPTPAPARADGAPAEDRPAPADARPAPAEDRILITFDSSLAAADRDRLVAAVAAGPLEQIGLRSYRVPVAPGTAAAAVEALRRSSGLTAERDEPVTIAATPNDSSYPSQWGLNNTGQIVHGIETRTIPGADANGPAAWSTTTGSKDVVVGIVDSGVDLGHPDLAPNLWSNPGNIGGCPAGTHGYDAVTDGCSPRDAGAHGTHVAGIIGARGDDGVGIAGVNWKVSLMGLRAGGAGGGEVSDLVEAIHWAVEAKRAGVNLRVLNASFGSDRFVRALHDEIAWAGTNDILVVAAAGNDAADVDRAPTYPCAFDLANVICVANIQSDDRLAFSSNFGATTVDLAAPGTDIVSTVPPSYVETFGHTHEYMSGTSMATPFVSGAAALALSQGYLPVEQLKDRILAAVDPLPGLAGVVRTGGRLNLCKVVVGCGQPPALYDDLADAHMLSSPGGRAWTSRGATRQSGEPAHGGASVWFATEYTAGGTLTVDATSAYRSRLAVYKGSGLGNLTLLAVSAPGRDHRLSIPSARAQTYRIALASDDGGSGPYSVLVTDRPSGNPPPKFEPPDPVSGVAASAGDGTASFTWTEPGNEHRVPISGFDVRLYRNGRYLVSYGVPAGQLRFDARDLANGATYSARVSARGPGGAGEYSPMSPGVVPARSVTEPAPAPASGDPGVVTAGPPAAPKASPFGYWMLNSLGTVYALGDAPALGDPAPHLNRIGVDAVDIEPSPSGRGYWVVDSRGRTYNFGEHLLMTDGIEPTAGRVVSMSATPSGKGYWIFTERGRVFAYGDAAHFGDLRAHKLNAAVLDSIPTPSGRGYYMVAADGGIFAFGDAAFYGSMGGHRLNSPVQSLVPDGDGVGYWLVAADGGVFAFNAPFRGSMGATKLNKPVSGMIRYGDGYLMVAEDGGIFNFSDRPFSGSLGSNPPPRPVVAVAALPG